MAMRAVPANRYIVFFSIAIVGCIVDLATKWFVFSRLGSHGRGTTWWVVQDIFGF